MASQTILVMQDVANSTQKGRSKPMKRIYKVTCPVCGVEVTSEDFLIICPHCGEMIQVEEERRE